MSAGVHTHFENVHDYETAYTQRNLKAYNHSKRARSGFCDHQIYTISATFGVLFFKDGNILVNLIVHLNCSFYFYVYVI